MVASQLGGFVPACAGDVCGGLIVNQGHPVQLYVSLRAIWDLLSEQAPARSALVLRHSSVHEVMARRFQSRMHLS